MKRLNKNTNFNVNNILTKGFIFIIFYENFFKNFVLEYIYLYIL